MIATPLQCVVDSSVLIKLYFTEIDSPKAVALLAHANADPASRFYCPELLFLECANILKKKAVQKVIPAVAARSYLTAIEALPLIRKDTQHLIGKALELALNHDLSAYDGLYVAVADEVGMPLITADDKLARKLLGTGHAVEILGTLIIPTPMPPSP